MRVLVTGGTGFIGRALCEVLAIEGHDVTVVTRTPEALPHGRAITWQQVPTAIQTAEAVINLAGEPIAGRRWTADRKRRIRASRVDATRALVDAMEQAPERPRVFLSGSAIGFYGPNDGTPLDETAGPGSDFLAGVCRDWEDAAERATELGVRVVRLRTGIVLADDGGALPEMVRPIRFFIGGPLGDGRQYLSWIHRIDAIGIIVAAMVSDQYRGAVNLTSLEPATNAEFTRALSQVMARPLPTPGALNGWIVRRAFGEMADMLLTGQCVLPGAAIKAGYGFRYPSLLPTLRSIIRA
jgi:uncharacterized protein